MRKIIYVMLSALLLSSCMGANTRVQELPVPPQPINHPGFTLLPPNETGWVVANMSKYNLSLAKRGKAIDETYAIQIMLFQLPIFDNNEEFKQYVIDGFNKDTDSTRFKPISSTNEIIIAKSYKCIKNRTSTEDTQPVKKLSSANNMILEVINYTCKHPSVQNAGANISYSNRYYSGHSDAMLDDHAEKLINNFTFTQ